MIKLRLLLSIRAMSSDYAFALLKSLKPDNIDLPDDMKIDMEVDGSILKLLIECSQVGSLINTMNDIFSCLQPAIKTISELKGKATQNQKI